MRYKVTSSSIEDVGVRVDYISSNSETTVKEFYTRIGRVIRSIVSTEN